MGCRRFGIIFGLLLAAGAALADRPRQVESGWPGAASTLATANVPHLFRPNNDYPIENQRIRLWEFRFSDTTRAGLLKSGSVELEMEGTGVSVKARF